RVAVLTWRFFLFASRRFGDKQGAVLSFCGPACLVALVLAWAALITVGSALVIQPNLGVSIQASDGATPRDFISALYAAGSSLAVVGASDFKPRSAVFQMYFLFNSLAGVSMLSLTLTYLMQIYTALHQRNSLGFELELGTEETGDAALLLAGLGPQGQFGPVYSSLANMAAEMSRVKQSHHFYPLLFYFRFPEPYYSVSRFSLVSLDAATLIQTALDDGEYSWLQRSDAVTQ